MIFHFLNILIIVFFFFFFFLFFFWFCMAFEQWHSFISLKTQRLCFFFFFTFFVLILHANWTMTLLYFPQNTEIMYFHWYVGLSFVIYTFGWIRQKHLIHHLVTSSKMIMMFFLIRVRCKWINWWWSLWGAAFASLGFKACCFDIRHLSPHCAIIVIKD